MHYGTGLVVPPNLHVKPTVSLHAAGGQAKQKGPPSGHSIAPKLTTSACLPVSSTRTDYIWRHWPAYHSALLYNQIEILTHQAGLISDMTMVDSLTTGTMQVV